MADFRIIVALAGVVLSGCLVHTKDVQRTERGPMRSERLSESVRARIAVRQSSAGLEIAAWDAAMCTNRQLQVVRTVNKKQLTTSGLDCSDDVCAALVTIFLPVTLVSAVVAIAKVSRGDEVVDEHEEMLGTESYECGRQALLSRLEITTEVDGATQTIRARKNGRAFIPASGRPTSEAWEFSVASLPGESQPVTIRARRPPNKNWLVVYAGPHRGPAPGAIRLASAAQH
jgi:hypothetical protein